MDYPERDRRRHTECQSVEVCDVKHDQEKERWESVQDSLKKLYSKADWLNTIAYTLLGGMVITLLMLVLDIILNGVRTFKPRP